MRALQVPVARCSAVTGGARPAALRKRISQPRCRSRVVTRARAEFKELLSTLQALSDQELATWAAQHRERLSLPFLGWLSDEELAAAGDPDHQQQLWELGSKLMALREGLSPVGAEVLQAELRAAALRSCGAGSSGSGSGTEEEGEEEEGRPASADNGATASVRRRQDAQQPPHAAAQGAATGAGALAMPAFASAVQQVAALGLSPEGLALFQQQAAALEAVVGTSRARSLTEVIGRARVEDAQQLHRVAQADAAMRILDVLLSVQDREERASMLPDAFTPPGSTAAVDDDAAYFSPDEDQLYTTPLRLLQAIDLYSARLQGRAAASSGMAALAGGGLGLSLPQLQMTLAELREDVDAYWQGGAGDAC